MGPLLLGRLLNLNDVQQGVLTLAFKIADDHGSLLLDLKDLRAMLQFLGDNAAEFKTAYGNVSAASVGAIQRGLLELEQQGGDRFFGEPVLNIADLIQTDRNGGGLVNLLAASTLINSPKVYSTFLLWGCSPNSSKTSPKWETGTSQHSCSSSTRPTCCSATRRRHWSKRSNRSFV